MIAHVTPIAVVAAPDIAAIAVAILISGLAALTVATLLADRGGLLPKSAVAFGQWTATVAMALSLGAAAIHFAVIGEHFAEYAPYGVAFTALAWFQVGWAVAAAPARRRSFALAAIAVNGGALAVWAVSRTVGLPIGPEPGELEPIGPLDLLAGVLEAGLIAVLAWDLGVLPVRARPALPAAAATLVVGSVALAVVLATSVALASAGPEAHQHAAVIEDVVEPGSSEIGGLEPGPSSVAPSPSRSAPPTQVFRTPTPAVMDFPEPSLDEPTALSQATPPPTPRATKLPGRTPRPTSRPAAPLPTEAPTSHPGVIEFGSAVDASGQILEPHNQFREGENAVWIADFRAAPGVTEILKLIIQVLPDGREFEHWREAIPLSDPSATRLVGHAELSLYAHGGEGSYRLRYVRGDTLLAEGTFELVP